MTQFLNMYWPLITTVVGWVLSAFGLAWFLGRWFGTITQKMDDLIASVRESKADIEKLSDTVHDHGERISKLEGVHLRKE